jgi:hypothetical protein
VQVAADVPEGTYDVLVIGKFGVSNPRLLAVSHGLSEVAEKEPNDEPAMAQPIAVNSVVNGMSDGNRDDVFRVALKKAQRVVVECQAQKLDSLMQPTIALTDSDGKLLASNGGYNGRDPLIDFVAPRDGEFFINVHDLSYRGGQPYRLVVTDHAVIENVFPRAIEAGKPAMLTIFGRNLGNGAKPSTWHINELPLDEITEKVSAPPDLLALGSYRFTHHPTTHSSSPTAATCTLTGFQVHGIPVLVTDTSVTLEREPNDDPHKPQPITLPAVVSGRFDHERDADWYEFEPMENGSYAFEVYCERIAGQADPYLVVVDDKDNRVAELDDFGHRINAFDGHLRDPSGMVNLNGKKKYRVLVQDRYRRGGARYQYVLAIHKPVPDFYPAVIHSQNPGPGGTVIRRGGASYLDVVIHSKDGFNDPITITAEGLPKGLHVNPTTINNDNHGVLVIWADKDMPDWTGSINLIATGKRGESLLKREVRPYTRVWTQADLSSSRPMRELKVAVREQAPFDLQFATDRLKIEAGKKVDLKLQLNRHWPDFKGPVNLLPLSVPGPMQLGQAMIGEGKTEAILPLNIGAGTRPGEYTLVVTGQAQVPFARDPKSGPKPTLVSEPSHPITLVVTPPKK